MFRIKKLDIFISKQFMLLFVGTFFICQFVLMMQFLWRYVDDLIGKGLSLDVLAQFFWWMGLMLMPQAFPLAILLSSLITFGNLGESSELTAIKAAGISLWQTMRSLIVIVGMIAGLSYFFQDVIGPEANKHFGQLLLAMKQTSPELEIPEGVFYDGLPGTNLYVARKDLKSGHLYGITIYRRTGSYEDQAIILADSGMLQSTADKRHMLLTLWQGEWFENMRSQDMGDAAEVPYRRETFGQKQLVLDYDGGFSMDDVADLSHNAKMKSNSKILHDLDSIRHECDSLGRAFYESGTRVTFYMHSLDEKDSIKLRQALSKGEVVSLDTLYDRLSGEQKLRVTKDAARQAQTAIGDLQMKSDYAGFMHRQARIHQMEAITKVTLALSCVIFFFIGAPLGAIIRKGGLGVPVIISVAVFIVYYIFENSGMRMAREDEWTVWFGKLISTMVLTPLAVFFTVQANKDSAVLNIDAYRQLMMRMLGLRMKRNVVMKEVIIEDPKYADDIAQLKQVNADIEAYGEEHKLLHWPSPIKVFFRPGDDHEIEHISEMLEAAIEDLGYTRDKVILHELNNYPILATHAHTRPFRKKWLNIITGLTLPLGIFFYIRMLRFRLRLYRDLRDITHTSQRIMPRAEQLAQKAAQAGKNE